ncbi:MAG: hypothetical protein MJE68_27250, partial [Proteobacteria bacterium]|nr:hypothetical protein [Pseudomonadota bacterium]
MAIDFIVNTLPQIIGTTGSILSITDYFARHHPAHTKEHLARNLRLMSEYMREKQHQSKDPGGTWRSDWFSENQVSNPRVLRQLLDKTVKEIINDSQESKSEYIAKFWVNICLTSNADIDEATAFSYVETIEALSWRQLCIIRLIVLIRDEKVTYDAPEGNDVKQMSKNERTSFHSISRDFGKLADAHYIQSAGMSTDGETHEPYASHPGLAQLPASTDRLHSLMNLNEIPIEDIV